MGSGIGHLSTVSVRSEDEETLLENAEAARTKKNLDQNERKATEQQKIKAAKVKTNEDRSEDEETLLAEAEAARRRESSSE